MDVANRKPHAALLSAEESDDARIFMISHLQELRMVLHHKEHIVDMHKSCAKFNRLAIS